MVKKLFYTLFMLALPVFLFAQTVEKETRVFAVKDGIELKMDIYTVPTDCNLKRPTIVFVFASGFIRGERDNAFYIDFFHYFAERGFVVISIDYRLGLTYARHSFRNFRNALRMGVSDLFSATNFILQYAEEWNIDTEKIIISGSSAGAITVLQADYELNSLMPSAAVLPNGFRYAGVISFSGAIFSRNAAWSYVRSPAPTLFFHGSADRTVVYNHLSFLGIGKFGPRTLTARFRARGLPFVFYSITGAGHEIAQSQIAEFLPEIEQFINDFVFNRAQKQIEIRIKNLQR